MTRSVSAGGAVRYGAQRRSTLAEGARGARWAAAGRRKRSGTENALATLSSENRTFPDK